MKKDRATKRRPEEIPYACTHKDCRRVTWESFSKSYGEIPSVINIGGCMECGRPTTIERVDVPDDTIMLDRNGDPIPKSMEEYI